MAVINYEVNLILTWSSTCGIANSTGAERFEIINAKLYIAVVTLSTLIMQNYFKYQNHKVEIKYYNVKIDSKNFFDQPIHNDTKTHENIRKINTGQEGYYTTGCLLDYPYFI